MRAALGPFLQVLRRLGVVLSILMALRVVFYARYLHEFPPLDAATAWHVLLGGLRFDAMTVATALGPWALLSLLPFGSAHQPAWPSALRWLFLTVNAAILFLVCLDLPFYGFNGKRVTRDLLGLAEAGGRELPSMLLRYWWATLILAGSVAALAWLTRARPSPATAPRQWLMTPPALAVLFVIGRGGWQYEGLSPANANDPAGPAWAPLVLNSAYTFGYSLASPTIQQRNWFDPATLDVLAPVRYELTGPVPDDRPNVVLIVVESLGREYIARLNDGSGYLPFVDSLCAHSLVLSNAYANAERTNKSLCAILAGIPSFTDEAFMNTPYAENRVEGMGSRLKEAGYATAFLHGGLNGEFKLDAFSRACGFDRYLGKDDYGDPAGYDGHWGIYDEEFLLWACDRLSAMPQPFCAVELTVSSHDPFAVPARYAGRFPKGTQEIHESLGYTDHALRRFFAKASASPWYHRTVFIITGDHTFPYGTHPPRYTNPAGRYAVPIILFAPDGRFRGLDDRVAQHLDLLPTVLDIAGYRGAVNTFGQSLLRRDRPDRALMQVGGSYRIVEDDRILLFDGQDPTALYAFRDDTLCAADRLATEPRTARILGDALKAAIQRHAELMLRNELRAR